MGVRRKDLVGKVVRCSGEDDFEGGVIFSVYTKSYHVSLRGKILSVK